MRWLSTGLMLLLCLLCGCQTLSDHRPGGDKTLDTPPDHNPTGEVTAQPVAEEKDPLPSEITDPQQEASVEENPADPDENGSSDEPLSEDDEDEYIEPPVSEDPIPAAHPERVVMGWVEWVCIQPETLQLKAKIDTGARTSSLNALDMVEFERDGKPWVRFHVEHPRTTEPIEFERPVVRYTRVIQHTRKPQRRPIVEMEVKLGPFHEKREFTLIDRSNFVYQVLIGRNFLRGIGLVDCEEAFLLGRPCGRIR